jgi:uncharacterized protein (DUF924 family)
MTGSAVRDWSAVGPEEVLDFWFPDDGHDLTAEAHRAFWTWRMRGGVDEPIRGRFTELTEAAARGLLGHWADTPRGRLALILALDQFPRSVWRDTPGAYAQDIKACRLVLEGWRNGHYDALATPWEKMFCLIANGHCEGPDHAGRTEQSVIRAAAIVAEAPAHLKLTYRVAEDQARLADEVIRKFGRYPHRNAVLGRISTPGEEAYIAAGAFPHLRQVPEDPAEVERMLARRESPV